MKGLHLIAGTAVCLALFSCGNSDNQQESNAASANDPVTAHIDSSYDPNDNFFMFANNGWFKANPIPSSVSSNGIFRTIQDTINETVRKICESSAADTKAAKGSNRQKIGDFYFSGMDTTTIDKAGWSAIDAELQAIGKVKNIRELLEANTMLQRLQCNSMFYFGVNKDEKKSSQYVVTIGQCRLGLPEREYYFNTDARTAGIRKEYEKHLAKMMSLSGMDESKSAAAAGSVMKIETALAKASRKMEDLRDPYKNYNKMELMALNNISPSLAWDKAFSELGLKMVDSVVVGQPEYLSALDKHLKSFSIQEWKSYLRWTLLNHLAAYGPKPVRDQNFAFYSGVLEGIKDQKPRWKQMVENTDHFLGELIGQEYVNDYLPKGTKEKLLEIGNNIRTVFAEHITALDWMSEPTKEKALSKLGRMTMKVGYPDKWKDMSSVHIDRANYLGNVVSIFRWNYSQMTGKYGKPVDRDEWVMYPQTYNAYYDPVNNEIVVPACNIIVPGFEGRMPDDAVLYGIIGGSTFGHEITHGFDDQGSQYDEEGNLRDWWTKTDREKFLARTKLIVEQFNGFKVLDSMHVNGENTQGENIADLGGVIMGLEAFRKTPMGRSDEKINGYSPEQRYFLAYAYAWMVNRTDASLAKQVMSDVHSPAEFRVNGPLSDVDAWYKAFGAKEGDKMYIPSEKRVRIW
jgi:putative endopeptidase